MGNKMGYLIPDYYVLKVGISGAFQKPRDSFLPESSLKWEITENMEIILSI